MMINEQNKIFNYKYTYNHIYRHAILSTYDVDLGLDPQHTNDPTDPQYISLILKMLG